MESPAKSSEQQSTPSAATARCASPCPTSGELGALNLYASDLDVFDDDADNVGTLVATTPPWRSPARRRSLSSTPPPDDAAFRLLLGASQVTHAKLR
jgi:hypothetical protein